MPNAVLAVGDTKLLFDLFNFYAQKGKRLSQER